MLLSQEEVKKVLVEVMKKASIDEEYRKLALEDPGKAIEVVGAGKELPEGYTVSFVEGNPDVNNTFVLPPLKTELSEEDLDEVAGGIWCYKFWVF